MTAIARKGVRWGLRVATLSPPAPQRAGAGLRRLRCPPSRAAPYSLSPSLLGERSPLHPALAAQRKEAFQRDPQDGELWESWRCIYFPAPQVRKGSPSLGSLARTGRRGRSVFSLELRRQHFFNLSLPPPSSRRHPRAWLPAIAVGFPTETRPSAGEAAGERSRSPGVWGNQSARAGWLSFVRFRAWGPKRLPASSPLGGKAQCLDHSGGTGLSGRRRPRGKGERGDGRPLGLGRMASTLRAEAPRASTSCVPRRSQAVRGREVAPAGKGALLWLCEGSLRGDREGLRIERVTRGQGQYGCS